MKISFKCLSIKEVREFDKVNENITKGRKHTYSPPKWIAEYSTNVHWFPFRSIAELVWKPSSRTGPPEDPFKRHSFDRKHWFSIVKIFWQSSIHDWFSSSNLNGERIRPQLTTPIQQQEQSNVQSLLGRWTSWCSWILIERNAGTSTSRILLSSFPFSNLQWVPFSFLSSNLNFQDRVSGDSQLSRKNSTREEFLDKNRQATSFNRTDQC